MADIISSIGNFAWAPAEARVSSSILGLAGAGSEYLQAALRTHEAEPKIAAAQQYVQNLVENPAKMTAAAAAYAASDPPA